MRGEPQSCFDLCWYRLSQVNVLLGLGGTATLDKVACLDYVVDELASLLVSLEVWIDLMGCVVVPDCLCISLKVLQDGGSVEEEIWVWFLHESLSLEVCLECFL